MRGHGLIACFVVLAACALPAAAAQFDIVDVPSLEMATPARPHSIAFAELHYDEATNPAGLVPFAEWAETKPLQKQFLSPYSSYSEPMVDVMVEGVTKPQEEKLLAYVAEAHFTLSRPPQSIDLARYATVNFLAQLDPAITHRTISPAEANNDANKNPERKWCEGGAEAQITCVQSKYQLEGKLPMAVQLVNQLTDNNKLADYLEFQSELRILSPSELDQSGLRQLTGIDAPVTGAIEQTIFSVNQLMQFGKFLAVFQENPANPGQTEVTAFIALALKARLLVNAKKYANVPVLRNLVPGMVLAGKSSFNVGRSISAGLPVFARNNVKAVAAILDGNGPFCPSCQVAQNCASQASILKRDAYSRQTLRAASRLQDGRLEPDLLQQCRQSLGLKMPPAACNCPNTILSGLQHCVKNCAGVNRAGIEPAKLLGVADLNVCELPFRR